MTKDAKIRFQGVYEKIKLKKLNLKYQIMYWLGKRSGLSVEVGLQGFSFGTAQNMYLQTFQNYVRNDEHYRVRQVPTVEKKIRKFTRSQQEQLKEHIQILNAGTLRY